MSVEVVPYDASWPALAASAIASIRQVAAPSIAEIEHIGSTSVPGLAAKPTIDLMAATSSLPLFRRHDPALAGIGLVRYENSMTDRLLYAHDDGARRTHILHVVTEASWPGRNQRMLRDYLREHSADAARYAALKYAVAASAMSAREYTKAKTSLIQELTDRARAALGLPSVPVWEK